MTRLDRVYIIFITRNEISYLSKLSHEITPTSFLSGYFHDHLRDVPWGNIFKPSASAAATEFCEWAQVGIDVYILHPKYQVKPHSSPWFSAACAAAIVHRDHFFHLYQQNKSSESKEEFRQASNLGTFGELLIVFSTKVNLLYLLYSTDRRCCLLHLIKQNYLLKTFPRTQILMTLISLYLFSLLELI